MILYSLPISNYCGKVLHALRFKDRIGMRDHQV